MADPVSELKAAIDRAIQRGVSSINAKRGLSLPAQSVTSANPLGATPGAGHAASFSTGYNGSVTVMPFMRGISNWNEDIWTA